MASNTELYCIWEGEPGLAPTCTHPEWMATEKGGILVRVCRHCTRTESSLPGVDVCNFYDERPYTTPPCTVERLLEAVRDTRLCETFTDGRCPHCGDNYCAEHLGGHQEGCERRPTPAG